MKGLTTLLITALLSVGSVAQERYVKPVDDAPKDPSLLAFRNKLIAAAERRDVNFIYSILDRNIKVSFGGEEGVADFKRTWRLENKDSRFWAEFLRVIRNGGRLNTVGRSKLFTAPYLFNSFPDDLDPFEYQAIFGSNVNLREAPGIASPVLTRLSYNIVRIDNTYAASESPDWHRVSTLGGLSGFVHRDYVRSPIDQRAGFEKKGGKWKMVFFIAGD